MLRSFLHRRHRWVIRVVFASGATTDYGPFHSREEAAALLASRWTVNVTPDPHDFYADVTSAAVLRMQRASDRPARDLMGRRFVQV